MKYNNRCCLPVFDEEIIGSSYRNSSFKLEPNSNFFIDTKLGEIVTILPSNPEIGDHITLLDFSNTWNVHNLIILNNTKRINNKLENLIVNVNNIVVSLIYYGDNSAFGWNVIVNQNFVNL